jgi:BCD family chlorophyll transporter-like MFS transporter
VQATGAGLAIGLAGITRDLVSNLALQGRLGPTLNSHATGYGTVYYIEIVLLLAGLIAIGPLSRHSFSNRVSSSDDLGLARLPT